MYIGHIYGVEVKVCVSLFCFVNWKILELGSLGFANTVSPMWLNQHDFENIFLLILMVTSSIYFLETQLNFLFY